jgi:hypothetical protein
MTNFERCIDGAGWLAVARTHPDWRGRGVAGFLVDQIAANVRPQGVRVLRLWTSPRNKPAIKSAVKNRFRSVCEAVHVSRRVGTRKQKDPTIPPANSVPSATLHSILGSRYLSKLNGYFPHDWHFVKATPQVFRATAARRELYVLDDISFVLTKPERWEEFNGTYASFGILSGPPTASLRSVQNVAKSKGIKYIGAYLPRDRYLIAASRNLGFRVDGWGKKCMVFEKTLS